MLMITLNDLAALPEHDPLDSAWRKLMNFLGKRKPDDEPFPFSALSRPFIRARYFHALPGKYQPQIIDLMCHYAEHVLLRVPERDRRPSIAIATTRKWMQGNATRSQVCEAASDAYLGSVLDYSEDLDGGYQNAYNAAAICAARCAASVAYSVLSVVCGRATIPHGLCNRFIVVQHEAVLAAYRYYNGFHQQDTARCREIAWQEDRLAMWADEIQ